ncbi:MAG: PQQ-dependent sugar dehydrogenase [Gammaproteobacteria bacterium]
MRMSMQAACLAVATMMAGDPAGAGDAPGAGDAEAGAQVIQRHCAACHGPTGRGAQGPSIVGAGWRHGSSDADLARSIRNGYPATGMPAWDGVLDDTAIRDVIAFIRANPMPMDALRPSLPADPMPTGAVRTDAATYRIDKVARLQSPYGMASLPDGRFLVTQATGELRFVDPRTGTVSEPIAGVPMGATPREYFHRRLLDVALPAGGASGGWIYMTRAEQAPGVTDLSGSQLVLIRGRIDGGRWVDNQELFRVASVTTAARIAFDGRGHVFLSVADYDAPESEAEVGAAQDLARGSGKILRLGEDGTAPADNPFANGEGAAPYVWSLGHRAALGLAFDRRGNLWSSENGPHGGDELNLILPGRNYGWPLVTWGHRYDEKLVVGRPEAPGIEQPVINWSPTPALSGMALYTGAAFPAWRDNLFIGSLKRRSLFRIVLSPANRPLVQEIVLDNVARIRDVETGADGNLYLLTDEGDMLRMRPQADADGPRPVARGD